MGTSGWIRVVVAALAWSFALGAAPAGAVTWHNSGDTAFTATSGAVSVSSTGATPTCPSATATGIMGASPTVAAVWTSSSGTVVFNSCSLSGIATGVVCNYAVTAFSQPSAGLTNGNIDLSCVVSQFNTAICVVTGTTPGTYTNPTTFGGRATLPTSTTPVVRNAASGTCPLGNGDHVDLTHSAFTVSTATGGPSSPHLGPVITRTS